MKQALYRKYRPAVFDEILGQNHIVRILKNQIATDAVSHAYLFCGTRGTGKTTVARILAKGINCTAEEVDRPCGECENCRAIANGTFFDVIEIDAASNNGVDNIRELRESVVYPPTVGRRKIYIIDEVHMLSNQAFNALLKTLEEPPEHVVFVLATTEPQKLPATILSRCMKLDFRRVPEAEILKGMKDICNQEGIEASDGALKVLSANADGSVRDGLSLLDQCLAAGQKKISREDVLDFLGTSGEEVFIELTDHVRFGETSEAIRLIDRVLADGKEVRQFMKDWLAHYRNLMIARFVKKPEEMLGMSCENVEKIHAQGEMMELLEINTAVLQLSEAIDMAKWSSQPRVLLELCAIKLSAPKMQEDNLDEKIKLIAEKNRTALAMKIEEKQVQDAVETQAPKTSVMDDEQGEEGDGLDALLNQARSEAGMSADAGHESKPVHESKTVQSGAPTEKAAEHNDDNYDLEKIWDKVTEMAIEHVGSANLFARSARLRSIADDKVTIEANNATIKGLIDKEKDLLQKLIEKQIGKAAGVSCVVAGEAGKKANNVNVDEIAAKASEMLNVDVEIKDI